MNIKLTDKVLMSFLKFTIILQKFRIGTRIIMLSVNQNSGNNSQNL